MNIIAFIEGIAIGAFAASLCWVLSLNLLRDKPAALPKLLRWKKNVKGGYDARYAGVLYRIIPAPRPNMFKISTPDIWGEAIPASLDECKQICEFEARQRKSL